MSTFDTERHKCKKAFLVRKTFCVGAENGTRTRDPDLGKVVLYQLSYFRNKTLVKRRRVELPRHYCHYPLKVARLPIPPSLHK